MSGTGDAGELQLTSRPWPPRCSKPRPGRAPPSRQGGSRAQIKRCRHRNGGVCQGRDRLPRQNTPCDGGAYSLQSVLV